VRAFGQQPAAAASCAVGGGHVKTTGGLHLGACPDTASAGPPHAHTFLQCAEYEHALKTGKSAHVPQQLSAPLAVSKLANRENIPSRALSLKGVPKMAAVRRSQPQLQPPRSSGSKMELEGRSSNSSHAAKKGGETEKDCRGAGGATSGGADHLARTVLQQAAARPTAVKARSAYMRKSATALCGSANGEHGYMDLEEAEGQMLGGGEGALHSMIGKADLLAALARGVGGAAATHARAARTSVEKDLMRMSAADLLVAINAVMRSAPVGGSDGEGATASV